MLPPRMGARPAGRPSADPDDAIRSTDDDAAASRLSAASLKYLDDPFVSLLYKPKYMPNQTPGAGPSTSSRKPPLINVGTHHRTYALDAIVDRFFEAGGRQVVSLGAGSDTRYWRLMSRADPPNLKHYVETDFPHMTSLKAQRIARSSKLSSLLSSEASTSGQSSKSGSGPTANGHNQASRPYTLSQGGTALSSSRFSLVPLDLRASPSVILDTHILPLLDPQLPTLFLAECVFCYMQPEAGREIISWFGSRFERCVGVVYEMCGLDDTFGQVMKRNLASRHLTLPGAIFPTPQAQAERFLEQGLGSGVVTRAGAKSLWEIRESVVPPEELQRISKLEFLDEIEELKLVLRHYCVAWGTKGEGMGDVGL